jgi:hypothetical protein
VAISRRCKHYVHMLISVGAVCNVDLQEQSSKTYTPLYLALQKI